MYYPEEVLEEVRSRNDILSVVGQYVKMTKRGGHYFGCCPFHNEKTPSFAVNPGKQMYYCFGCGAGGDVVRFVMSYENYTFTEAVKSLADRAGITLPEAEETEEQKARASLRQKLLEVNREAATYYYYQMRKGEGQRAWQYLTGRGLTPETIRNFGLGYSPNRDDLYRHLKSKGFDDQILSKSGLFRINERGVNPWFWNRAMFPIMDVNSRVIGFGGRVMGDGEPKYLNSPETLLFDKSRNLYGLHLARRSRKPYFLLCEGYMDVIALHQAGFDCAVASLGTAFTPGHCNLIRRFVKEVIITYDSDGAGQKAAMRAIPILRENGIAVRVLNMQPWKDPDEFILHEGAEAYQKRIDEAVNAFLFECDVIRKDYDLRDPGKKTEFHRQVAARLLRFPDELERNNYLDAVCARQEIPRDALRDMVRRMAARAPEGGQEYDRPGGVSSSGYPRKTEPAAEPGQTPGPQRRERKAKDKEEGVLQAQRLVLNWAVSEPGRREILFRYLKPGDFSHPMCRQLAEILYRDMQEGRQTSPAAVMSRFAEDEEADNQLAAVFNTTLPEDTEAAEETRILTESIRRIRRLALDREARTETDHRKLQEIILERARLQSRKIQLK